MLQLLQLSGMLLLVPDTSILMCTSVILFCMPILFVRYFCEFHVYTGFFEYSTDRKTNGRAGAQWSADLSAAAAVSVSASSSSSASAGAVPPMTTSLPVDISAASALGAPKEDSASGAEGPENNQ